MKEGNTGNNDKNNDQATITIATKQHTWIAAAITIVYVSYILVGGGWNDSKNPGASGVKYTTTTAAWEQIVELVQSNHETTHFVSTTNNKF